MSPNCCHIVEKLLDSDLNNPFKTDLIRKLSPNFVTLGCDKYGSRVVDAAWRILPDDEKVRRCSSKCSNSFLQKTVLDTSLVNGVMQLEKNMYGRIVIRKCMVREYMRDRDGFFVKRAKSKRGLEDKSVLRRKKAKRTKASPGSGNDIDAIFADIVS